MINKKIILLVSLFTFLWLSFAQVNLSPVYSPDRFQPSDKFHAGCDNQIDINFDLPEANINGVNAILKYDSEDITVSKIFPQGEKENNLSYVVEDGKISFNKLKTDNGWLDKVVFQLFFESKSVLKSTSFSFVTWSYVLDDQGNMIDLNTNYQFDFVSVPECDPDIISPSIEMIFPIINTGEYVALDSYFQFNISDQGKWINEDSIKISIDDIKYDLSNIEHEWSWEILTIYPDTWLSIWEIVVLEILVWDKQVYGKTNITNKQYELQTSTWLYLLNEIDPVQFRKLVNKEKYYQWSQWECDLLGNAYTDAGVSEKEIIMSINKRLSCGEIILLPHSDSFLWGDGKVDIKFGSWFSVFAMFGWMLFWLLLLINIFGYFSRGRKE